MIDITTALYNILHSRYGRDVRQSIHDGIYQINENANEALQNAKTMGVGTLIDSPTSSSTGYVAGNLYLNSSTWDLWQCAGIDSWVNMGNIKGATGDKGADGVNNFIHIRYSQYYDGTDFTATPTASSQYLGVYYGTSNTAPTNKQAYQWTTYVGAAGTNAYVHIRYSEYSDGTNFVDVPTALCKYIGFYAGSSSSAPAGKQFYTWSEYVGKNGTGSGDMEERIYAPSGVPGTVDKALHADDADTATDATNAENLKKANGDIVPVDKITAVPPMISDEFGAKPTNYVAGDYCIKDNKLYKANGDTSRASWVAANWDEVSVTDEIGTLNQKLTQKTKNHTIIVPTVAGKYSYISSTRYGDIVTLTYDIYLQNAVSKGAIICNDYPLPAVNVYVTNADGTVPIRLCSAYNQGFTVGNNTTAGLNLFGTITYIAKPE